MAEKINETLCSNKKYAFADDEMLNDLDYYLLSIIISFFLHSLFFSSLENEEVGSDDTQSSEASHFNSRLELRPDNCRCLEHLHAYLTLIISSREYT